MKRFCFLTILATSLILNCVSTGVANAGFALSTDAQPSMSIQGRARNGNNGFEGILMTPGLDPNMNPLGVPVWDFTQFYRYQLNWTASTGLATWSIDFNRDNDFSDAQESVSQVTTGLIGKTFQYINLRIEGNAIDSAIQTIAKTFSINGVSKPDADGTTTTSPSDVVISKLYKFDGGGAGNGDLTIAGEFRFTGKGSSQEIPRLWVGLGEEFDVPSAAVPEPASIAMWSLGAVGMMFVRRKRQQMKLAA